MKKVLFVIAYKDFRDEEYFVLKEILGNAGVKIKTASNKIGQALGTEGGQAPVDFLVAEANLADFDAVIFIGGGGALENLDNEQAYRLIKETVKQNKILAAICIAPAILAKAGVLQNKKATVWTSPMDKSAVKILKKNGAVYQSQPVVVDDKIITADGPEAAAEFGKTIANLLKA